MVTRMKSFSLLLSLCLCGTRAVVGSEKPAPAPATTAASEATDESGRRAAADTAAAIEALGANPSTRQISNIVFKAVRNSPANVLRIVDAAVRVSPQAAAPEIVTAATAAVPNPWKPVTYRRITARHPKSGRDFKGGPDGDRVLNLSGHSPRNADGTRSGSASGSGAGSAALGDPSGGAADTGLTLTLAEAIARTAFDAQPGLAFPALQSAVDIALNTDPATLLRNIQSPRSVSGVGDAGSSNFANEPLRTRGLRGNAVPAPNPPVVSR